MKTLWLSLIAALALSAAPACHAQYGSCSGNQVYNSASLTASTQLIAAPTSGTIRICAVTIEVSQSSSAVTWGLSSGTGSACGTSTAKVTPAFLGVASTAQWWSQVFGSDNAIRLPPGTALCLTLGGTPTGAVVQVVYAVY